RSQLIPRMSFPIPTPDPNSAAWSQYLDNQLFNLTGLDGNPVTLSLTDVNASIYYTAATAVAYGFSLGTTGLLAILLILLTDSKKIRRPIIVLNVVCLVLFAIRSVMYSIFACKGFWNNVGEV